MTLEEVTIDRLGRKPVLLLGLFGASLSIFLFGLSKSLSWALITRSLSGILISGNAPVCHSAIADVTDETNQALAFISMGLAVKISQIIAFFLGYVSRQYFDLSMIDENYYVYACTIYRALEGTSQNLS